MYLLLIKPLWALFGLDICLSPVSNKGIETIVRFLTIIPSGADLIQFDSYGGALGSIPKEATAFAHRAGTLYSIQYMVYWRQAEDEEKCLKWIRDLCAAMGSMSGLHRGSREEMKSQSVLAGVVLTYS